MAILVTGQLYPRFERLWAVWTCVGTFLAVRQQVMIVNGGCLEALSAMLTSVRPHACMCTHVKGQTVGHTKGFATNLTSMRLLPSVNSFVLDFLMWSGEPATAMLALIGFLTVARICRCHRRRRCRYRRSRCHGDRRCHRRRRRHR